VKDLDAKQYGWQVQTMVGAGSGSFVRPFEWFAYSLTRQDWKHLSTTPHRNDNVSTFKDLGGPWCWGPRVGPAS
jgi:hypothetical protein